MLRAGDALKRGARSAECRARPILLGLAVVLGALRCLRSALHVTEENVIDERRFSRAADAGDADEETERNLDVDVLKVIVPSADDTEPLLAAGPALRRNQNLFLAGKVLSGEAVRMHYDVREGAGCHHLAAADAGARTEINEIVGRPHGLLVVLDDDDGVAHVAEFFEAAEQAVVVAWVQADARLVENIEHTNESAADLTGKANALGLTAGERRRGAVERKIVQADVHQEAEPAANLLEHLASDGVLERIQLLLQLSLIRIEPVSQIADRHGADVGQRLAADADGACLSVQPLALAGRARDDPHVLFELQAARSGRGFLEAAQELRHDPFPFAAVLPDGAAAHLPFERDMLVAAPVENPVAMLLGQIAPRRLQIDAKGLGHALEDVLPPSPHAPHAANQRNRPVEKAQRRIGDEQLGGEIVSGAKAVAIQTHSLRTVETKELRAGRLVASVAVRAGITGGEQRVRRARSAERGARCLSRFPLLRALRALRFALSFLHGHDERSFAERQRLFHRFGQSRPDFGLALEPVDHDFDVVLDAAIEFHIVGQTDDTAIDAGADEAAFEHVFEEVLVFAFLAADYRRQHEETAALLHCQNAGDDLFAGLGGDWAAALRAMPLADAREQDAEIIVDFGDGADGRPRVTAGSLLLNADGGRQAAQIIDIRLGQLTEELAGVAR